MHYTFNNRPTHVYLNLIEDYIIFLLVLLKTYFPLRFKKKLATFSVQPVWQQVAKIVFKQLIKICSLKLHLALNLHNSYKIYIALMSFMTNLSHYLAYLKTNPVKS